MDFAVEEILIDQKRGIKSEKSSQITREPVWNQFEDRFSFSFISSLVNHKGT